VSWAAIVAGAVAACGVSLILLALGSGLGLASISPWGNRGASATTFTVMTAIWFVLMQWIASGLGGYLTGRLRTKWVGAHTHEVFFRDTAHGFVSWAVATVITVAIVSSATSAAVSTGVQAASTVAAGAAEGAGQSAADSVGSVSAYAVDSLFRSAQPDTNASSADARAETTRILTRSLANGSMDANDREYLAKLIAARAGVSEEEAQKRLDQATAQIKAADVKVRQAADTARQAGAAASIYAALSMLIGAFIASVAGALGGRQRDEHV
jgi:ribosomal protein L11